MLPDPSGIIDLANAFYRSGVLFAAADTGVFDVIAQRGEATCTDIAQAASLNERGTRLLLDACCAIGLLRKSEDRYSNTPSSQAFLVSTSPGSLASAIRYNRDVFPAWGNVAGMVRTGAPVESPSLHLGDDEERTRTFVMSMHGRAMGIGRMTVPLLQLQGRRKLLDVGGGPGTFSVLISRANPEIECTVLDLPPVVRIAAELIAQQGASDRVHTLPGDYHATPFPRDIDAVLFSGMLHQESPDSIRDLFSRAWEALEPGGVVYVMDLMTDSTRTAPEFSALFAVNMALTTDNGWVFSDSDLKGWLTEAGFESFEIRPLPPPMPHWLARAVKPGKTN